MTFPKLAATALAIACSTVAVSAVNAAPTLVALTSFGGGDGWRAPNEVLTGDTAGTTGTPTAGAYNYLQTGSLERGLAYNPVTGNLVLVSRATAGNGIRLLSGVSGVDIGSLSQTGLTTGPLFPINKVGVGGDGQTYVAGLQTNAATANYVVNKWTNDGSTPTAYFAGTVSGFTGTPRLGDSLDVTGSGAGTTLVAGVSGTIGYAVLNGGTATAVTSFTPTGGPASGDFRLGITFAGSTSAVWGKQTGGTAAAAPLKRTTYSGSTGTAVGSNTLLSGGEAPMDYATIGGIKFLATLDANSSIVRIYDATDASNLALVASLTTTTGTLIGNGNGAGDVAWGAITGSSATIYAMSTNQGIQAFTFTVPEPTTLSLLAGAGVLGLRRRK